MDWLTRGFLFATIWPCTPFPVSNRFFYPRDKFNRVWNRPFAFNSVCGWKYVEFYLHLAIHLCYFVFKCHIFPPLPMPPHVLCGLRGSPSWAWQECNQLLRLGRPWGAVTLSRWCVSGDRGGCSARRGLKPKSLLICPDHGHCGNLPLQGKFPL